jgi:hypothetical protein
MDLIENQILALQQEKARIQAQEQNQRMKKELEENKMWEQGIDNKGIAFKDIKFYGTYGLDGEHGTPETIFVDFSREKQLNNEIEKSKVDYGYSEGESLVNISCERGSLSKEEVDAQNKQIEMLARARAKQEWEANINNIKQDSEETKKFNEFIEKHTKHL